MHHRTHKEAQPLFRNSNTKIVQEVSYPVKNLTLSSFELT